MNQHYLSQSYDTEPRFGSYWYQIQEVVRIWEPDAKILEIGPGNNFFSEYLSKRGIQVETLDIIPDSSPTYVGTFTAIPCEDEQFQCVCAFQSLEHQPFEKLQPSLEEMARVSRQFIIFSVPDVRFFVTLDLKLIREKYRILQVINLPRIVDRHLPPVKTPACHYWEIGRAGFSVKQVLEEIKKSHLRCLNHYRIPLNPKHHLFLLSKI